MNLDTVSRYLDSGTLAATFYLPSAAAAIKNETANDEWWTTKSQRAKGAEHGVKDRRRVRGAGYGVRGAGYGVRGAGYGVRGAGCGLRPRKFQAPKNKSQTNPNDQNS